MTLVVENFRLTAALEYAARGWRVFPVHNPLVSPVTGATRCSCGESDCGSVGKHPRTPNGVNDATDDADMIRAWWNRWAGANVGIATGALSGVAVVDIDADKGGEATWAELIATYGEIPATPVVESGGGGQHLFFAYPAWGAKNSAEKIGKGIDTRGDGGYVVAAPSLHRSTSRYAWRVGPDEVGLAQIPAWLKTLWVDPPKAQQIPNRQLDDHGRYWLGKALAKTTPGTRNHTGHWLACQLRDAKVSETEALSVIRDYADRVPRGDEPYTHREAEASVRSAYGKPAREPAKNLTVAIRPMHPAHAEVSGECLDQPIDPPVIAGASQELGVFLGDVVAGRVISVPFPWPMFTSMTQALIPGTTTVLVGDPGVGKTYFVLQCLLEWMDNGIDAAAFFIEKNRRFHMMRLLAQLENDAHFLDYPWLARNEEAVNRAMDAHADTIDRIGHHVYSSEGKRVTLDSLLGWIKQMASMGRRVIVVDPLTAIDAGADRWTKDDEFVLAAEHTATAHGASLVFITHARKGNRPGVTTGHDTAGGAAYFRFCDTLVWLSKPKKARRVQVQTRLGPAIMTPGVFFQLYKTRNGKGAGHELAFNFGDELRFAEQGIVIGEAKEAHGDAA